MEPTTDALTPDESIGLDILARAERPDGAITMDEATRIARAVGWPPVRLDAEGAVRAPTADELARWCSPDAAIVDAMEWSEIGEEIEHRSPAIARALLASARAAVLALRDRDRGGVTSASVERVILDTAADEPVADHEIEEWTRIGCVLVEDPPAFRRVLAALAALHGMDAGAS